MAMPALALTDTNNLSGAVEFYELSKAAGIKPIIGAEIVLTDDSSIILLVKNTTGYHHLCDLITHGKLQGGHLRFCLDPHYLAAHADGLICLAGGKSSNIYQSLQRRNRRQALHHALLWKEIFKNDFYIELQSFHPHDDFAINYLTDLAKAIKITTVATNDVHMLQPQELEIWRVLQAIDQNTLVNEINLPEASDRYFKSALLMEKRFGNLPDALRQTIEIANKCEFEFALGKPVFPTLQLNHNVTALQRLQQLCEIGLQERYQPITSQVRQRLEREITTINNLGFAEYFLIVKDIVDFCRQEQIPCVGRGSAADSLVSYLLGITRVDPIRYELYFERFLNPERTDAPDIDLDICWKNRERVLHYVYQKYSHEKTALIATFVTFQMRSSIREIAKTFGLPDDEIKHLTKNLPHRGIAALDHALARIPECEALATLTEFSNTSSNVGDRSCISFSLLNKQKSTSRSGANNDDREPVLEKILRIARFIADFPRHLSVHPGGTIIAPDKITHFTPLEIAGGGLIISQYDMKSIEKLGLVKMDLLGVRSLSVITDTVHLVQQQQNQTIDLDTIAENDAGALKLIRSTNTLGCFQLESPGMRGLLRKMQVENLDDVIAAISLIRPGPSEGGMKELYIRRHAGLVETTYLHPILEPILKPTYGIILYQEQVLLVSQAVAGLTLGEADILRRAITKHRNDVFIQSLHQRFIDGALQRDFDRDTAEKIWIWLTHFIGYGFNKAHSSTYGLLAYQTAYLKHHFPQAYMVAVLNNDSGFYPRFAYIEEARRLGIKILPPDVLKSDALFTIENNALRVGLASVFDLRHDTIQTLIDERRQRSFRDIYDIILRTNMNQTESENLARCGAFSALEESEALALTKIRIFFKNHHRRYLAEIFTKDLQITPYPKYQKILNELELLQFAVTSHPLALFLENNPRIHFTPTTELEQYNGKQITVIGWVITSRRLTTAKSEYMKFITISDLWGTAEIVLFPAIYRQAGRLNRLSGPLQIIGQIQSRVPGEVNVIAEKVLPLHLFPARTQNKIKVPEFSMTG